MIIIILVVHKIPDTKVTLSKWGNSRGGVRVLWLSVTWNRNCSPDIDGPLNSYLHPPFSTSFVSPCLSLPTLIISTWNRLGVTQSRLRGLSNPGLRQWLLLSPLTYNPSIDNTMKTQFDEVLVLSALYTHHPHGYVFCVPLPTEDLNTLSNRDLIVYKCCEEL